MSIKLAIGDELLVMQTAAVITTPWQYQLIYLPTLAIVASETGITDDYKLVSLVSATYSNYEGKSLLLEIMTNAGILIEDDMLRISGPYGKLADAKLTAGLLGENVEHETSLSTDFQDGHEVHKTVNLYDSATLTSLMASYEWNQSFVADFTPDARYQTQQIKQRKT